MTLGHPDASSEALTDRTHPPSEDQVHALLEAYGATPDEREAVWGAFFGRDAELGRDLGHW